MIHPIREIILLIFLVLLCSLFSAAERAFSKTNEKDIENGAAAGNKRAKRLLFFLREPDRYFDFVAIMISAMSIIIGITFSSLLCGCLYGEFAELGTWAAYTYVKWLFYIAVTFILIYIVVFFSKFLPHRIASGHPAKTALSLVGYVNFFYYLFRPVTKLLELNSLVYHISTNEESESVTGDEIETMVNESHEQGNLAGSEARMISNILDFDEKEANDIMTHRNRITAINGRMKVSEALNFILNENYSRFPVYDGDIDNIVGILHLKDAVRYYNGSRKKDVPVIEVARKPVFIPDTQKIEVLFKQMQKEKTHMVIAVDEYGQTSGIVAMEDILEEIVGDIQDEYDEEEKKIRKSQDGSYIVNGDMLLTELSNETGIKIRETELNNFDTVNGLVVFLLDHIPHDRERFSVKYAGYKFDSLKITDRMIKKVRMTKIKK